MTADSLGSVSLVVPADVAYFRSVRLAVGGLATLVGFDVEAIDDIRIGVDELCGTLEESGDGSDLTFAIETRIGGSIRIVGSTQHGGDDPEGARFEFSDQILSVVADRHGFDVTGGVLQGWLERALVAADQPGTAGDGTAASRP